MSLRAEGPAKGLARVILLTGGRGCGTSRDEVLPEINILAAYK